MGGMLVAKGVLQPVHLLSLPSPEEVGRLVQQGAPLVCCIGAVVAAIFTATNLATGTVAQAWRLLACVLPHCADPPGLCCTQCCISMLQRRLLPQRVAGQQVAAWSGKGELAGKCVSVQVLAAGWCCP